MPAQTYAPSLDTLVHPPSKQHLDTTVELAVSLLKRRQIRGAEPCALATAHVLAQVVATKSKWGDVDQLLDRVYQTGRKLVDAQPQELVIGNIVRRVLGLIRDEAEEDREGLESMAGSMPDLRLTPSVMTPTASFTSSFTASSTTSTPGRPVRQASAMASGPYQSMFSLLSAEPVSVSASSNDVSSAGSVSGASTPVQASHPTFASLNLPSSAATSSLRDEILDGIEEIKDEIGQADDQIAGFAEAQVRPGDYVMVYEPSRTVEKFLIKAARRKYTLLLVTAGAPNPGNKYASLLKKLAAAKCTVIQISGGATAPYMSRVSRVVLDARAIANDGGILANAGAVRLARAAKQTGTLVLALGGVYRLSPEAAFASHPEAFVEWGEPAPALFRDGSLVTDTAGGNEIEVETAVTEYVPAKLIDVYVTNLGPHSKDYLESVIADHYKTDDMDLYRL